MLGGPIGAYEDDRYPFLSEELRLIERALEAADPRTRYLSRRAASGTCARRAGLSGAGREIGIAPIELRREGQASCLKHLAPGYRVFHWHGDTFDLPDGAVRLASTAMTPNQAFARGDKVLGLQFHIEAETRKIERWLIGHTCELGVAGLDVAALREDLRRAPSRCRAQWPICDRGMAGDRGALIALLGDERRTGNDRQDIAGRKACDFRRSLVAAHGDDLQRLRRHGGQGEGRVRLAQAR